MKKFIVTSIVLICCVLASGQEMTLSKLHFSSAKFFTDTSMVFHIMETSTTKTVMKTITGMPDTVFENIKIRHLTTSTVYTKDSVSELMQRITANTSNRADRLKISIATIYAMVKKELSGSAMLSKTGLNLFLVPTESKPIAVYVFESHGNWVMNIKYYNPAEWSAFAVGTQFMYVN